MKHTKFVYAAVVSLFVCGFAEARVEAEYSGNYEQTGTENSVWGAEPSEPPVALTQPTSLAPSAVEPAPILSAPAPKPVSAKTSDLVYAPAGEYAATNEMYAKHAEPQTASMRITPMFGSGDYLGLWSLPNKNNYSLGLAVELVNDSPVALEIEGGYANHSLAYTSLAEPSMGFAGPRLMAHNFDVFTLGANAKVYVYRGTIRPYVGGGLAGVYYSRMQQRMPGDFVREFDEIIGAGQLLGGADIAVSKSAAIGIRGSWMVPLFDKPFTRDNGMNSAPGFEEAALINTSYYKIMGTVSVDL